MLRTQTCDLGFERCMIWLEVGLFAPVDLRGERRIPQRGPLDQRHRVDPDRRADHELLAGEPHAVVRDPRQREGVGGVRQASFAGGVVFVETVTVWEPGERLEFSIAADPNSIPMRTLDQHVTVGGEFFDVLEGRYRIERLSDPSGSRVRLHLASRHRVSTRFNVYARLWTDFVMSDIQRSILQVVADRAISRAVSARSSADRE